MLHKLSRELFKFQFGADQKTPNEDHRERKKQQNKKKGGGQWIISIFYSKILNSLLKFGIFFFLETQLI